MVREGVEGNWFPLQLSIYGYLVKCFHNRCINDKGYFGLYLVVYCPYI